MASPTAVLKRIEEQLAFLSKAVSALADNAGIDLDALISEVEEEEAVPDRSTLKTMKPVPEPAEVVPGFEGSELVMEQPEEVALPVAEDPTPPKKTTSRSKTKSATD